MKSIRGCLELPNLDLPEGVELLFLVYHAVTMTACNEVALREDEAEKHCKEPHVQRSNHRDHLPVEWLSLEAVHKECFRLEVLFHQLHESKTHETLTCSNKSWYNLTAWSHLTVVTSQIDEVIKVFVLERHSKADSANEEEEIAPFKQSWWFS